MERSLSHPGLACTVDPDCPAPHCQILCSATPPSLVWPASQICRSCVSRSRPMALFFLCPSLVVHLVAPEGPSHRLGPAWFSSCSGSCPGLSLPARWSGMALCVFGHPVGLAGDPGFIDDADTKRPLLLPAFLEGLEMLPGVVQPNVVSAWTSLGLRETALCLLPWEATRLLPGASGAGLGPGNL